MLASPLLRAVIAILRTVEHRNDRNLVRCLVDLVHNDVGQAADDPFVGPPRAADMSDLRQHCKTVGSVANARDNLGCRPRISLLDVLVNIFDIALGAPSISNLHRPHFFQSAAISSSVA